MVPFRRPVDVLRRTDEAMDICRREVAATRWIDGMDALRPRELATSQFGEHHCSRWTHNFAFAGSHYARPAVRIALGLRGRAMFYRRNMRPIGGRCVSG